LGAVFCVVGDVTLAGTAPAPRAVITNGDFETGLRGWLAQGTVALSSVAHQSKWSAEVGGTRGHTRDSALSTTFEVPNDGGALRLWYRVTCLGTVADAWATVTLTDLATHSTAALLAKTCTNSGRWMRLSANMASHANHRVRLTLASHDDRLGSPSYVYYDNVTLAHPDFSVSTVRTAAVAAGASTKVRVATARTVGSARTIHLFATHLPYGVTATWSHTSVEAGASSILTLTATNTALGTSARVSVVGRSATATHVALLSLKVTTGPTSGDREIDRPAINREFPKDAVVNVKTAFGAKGNGVTDDTAAIRAAIAAGLGTGAPSLPHKTLYFPKGTYLVSGSLMWKLASGQWSTSLTFQGENRDQTIIKLKNHAPGFNNPATPQAVIDTASNNASDARGSGNQAFDNFIFDLTVDVGRGNPGAVGIDYMANNRGAIRNVVVRAPSGSGQTGIAMTRPWPGPCLLQDVRVVGFGVGIKVTQPEYSVTMENIDLVGQHVAGFSNTDNVVSIHNLTSTNSVPAVVNTSTRGMVSVVEAKLVGGSRAHSAIENRGLVYLRGVSTSGYRAVLFEHDRYVGGSSLGEFLSGEVRGLFPPVPAHSLDLAIADPPRMHVGPPSTWVSVRTYGAVPDGRDSTDAIQAALNSGRPTVYFPPGQYAITHTLTVGPTVREVLGFNSTLYAQTGDFAAPNADVPLMRFTGPAAAVTAVRELFMYSTSGVPDIVDGSAGTVFLQDDMLSGSYQNEVGAGPLFLDDVAGGPWSFTNQHVWARQLDPENSVGTKISNNAGTLWIFGLKTERPTTVLSATNGGSTELLGGFVYPVESVPPNTPVFEAIDSHVSLNYLAQMPPSDIQISETENGVTRTQLGTQSGVMPLYVG